MGRRAFFLIAVSSLPPHHEEDGPHLIYVPEVPLTEERFLTDVDRVYSRHGRCLIACSEGISTPAGVTWAEQMTERVERDAHGNVQLSGTGALGDYLTGLIIKHLQVKDQKKVRVRADTFGYLQRSFPGLISEVDAREARMVGQKAVHYSLEQDTDGSVAMRRRDGEEYRIETFLTPLHTVAKETRHMDPSYIENGNNVTEAFMRYARPLVGELPVAGSFDELQR
jgi:ATP-dependent phosphofructokinase / diphosphate-dependent phosphofructokinase